jgi:hypothetical protein
MVKSPIKFITFSYDGMVLRFEEGGILWVQLQELAMVEDSLALG